MRRYGFERSIFHVESFVVFAFFRRLGITHLIPKCFLSNLLALLIFPLLANQLGEAGRGKILRNKAAIKAGMAPVAKITYQV